jgi:DNA-binding response OmpR family regulator
MKDKVLIVEDEKDTSFILEKLLLRNNYEVVCATNGQEAIQILKNFSPKVILADWTMPVLDGLTLCNILKSDKDYKHIYFILLTAKSTLRDRIVGLDVGADDFLIKPIENQELLARIRSGIRISNLQEDILHIEHTKAIFEIACTIGHKINNPLSSLVLSLKNIEMGIPQDDKLKYQKYFSSIDDYIENIKKLTKELIHLHNSESPYNPED